MPHSIKKSLIILCFALTLSTAAWAADYTKEVKWNNGQYEFISVTLHFNQAGQSRSLQVNVVGDYVFKGNFDFVGDAPPVTELVVSGREAAGLSSAILIFTYLGAAPNKEITVKLHNALVAKPQGLGGGGQPQEKPFDLSALLAFVYSRFEHEDGQNLPYLLVLAGTTNTIVGRLVMGSGTAPDQNTTLQLSVPAALGSVKQTGATETDGAGKVRFDIVASANAGGPQNITLSNAKLVDQGAEVNIHAADTNIPMTDVTGRVKEISFTGDNSMYKWSTGAAINDPVWTSSGTDLPACYTRNTEVSMKVTLDVIPDLPAGQSLQVGLLVAAAGGLGTNSVVVDLAGTEVQNISITTQGKLSNVVYKATPTFNWSLLSNFQTNAIGSTGPHTIYVTHASPLVSTPYDLALEKACGYVAGSTNYAGKINTGIDSDITYRPWQAKPSGYETGDGSALKAYGDGAAQCDVNAYLLKYLMESIGTSGGSVTYYWGGANSGEGTYYHPPGGTAVEWCSFKCDRPAHDDESANPRFTFHTMTIIAGTVYDPSYGVLGAPSFLEFAPADVDEAPTGNFPGTEDTDWDGDGILDPAGSIRTGNRGDWEGQNTVGYPYWAPAP